MNLKIKKLLVANRSEIAIRIMRAANELGIQTVAIYAAEDKLALHRFKADESYCLGQEGRPVASYLDIEKIIEIAIEAQVDAIHPGYGFLSENPDFVKACKKKNIKFIGPSENTMRSLGNKIEAKKIAKRAQVPTIPASEKLPSSVKLSQNIADKLGYPLMLKASWGGGGRGMRRIHDSDELREFLPIARREALNAFGNDEVYLEKLITSARHVEVQILGDSKGNLVHLFERDCTVQRRNQKIIERAPAAFLSDEERDKICTFAIKIGEKCNYEGAGTVEFLYDCNAKEMYFIEVNPRIQVEHTVTEEITGIDIVKAQIKIAEGEIISEGNIYLPSQKKISYRGYALQCRITTENPENNFIPDFGSITNYRSPAGFGVRLDGGTAYSGAVISPFYDSLLAKLTTWAQTADEAIARMQRALREFRVRGVSTNLLFLEQLIDHKDFKESNYTTNFIDTKPELFHFPRRRDRATRLLTYLADISVNQKDELQDREKPNHFSDPQIPKVEKYNDEPTGKILERLGPDEFCRWLYKQKKVLITDTTMRDGHQSLLATRFRSYDLYRIAETYNTGLSNLLSLECWGGATFDVAMRFLDEDPWERLDAIKQKAPDIPLQMLLRASNAVGYTSYPDNLIKSFVSESANAGINIFRVFDSLNGLTNMKVAMSAVLDAGGICEGTICYTGDMTSKNESKYTLQYYLDMAIGLKKLGAQIIGIKDMAGVCKPQAISVLVKAIKNETHLPVHFHTHDTGGISATSVLSAVNAGVDAVDLAMDSMSGMTSQPSLGSVVETLQDTKRDPRLNLKNIRKISHYWEQVRENYKAFESEVRASTSDVYMHAMPGGQYTNLREQARSMGLANRWPEVAEKYAVVNEMFGNIVKVTPSSKVVGDMALAMVAGNLSQQDVLNPKKEISFPESVISMFQGELGQPKGGFPRALSKKILKGRKVTQGRAGAKMKPANIEKSLKEIEKNFGRKFKERDAISSILYPKVFHDYQTDRKKYSDLSILTTPIYFYGLDIMQEVSIEIEKGKALVVRMLGINKDFSNGTCQVFFELNGQPRTITTKLKLENQIQNQNNLTKFDKTNKKHLATPIPGKLVELHVEQGSKISAGDPIASIEAMKMETVIRSDQAGTIKKIYASIGDTLSPQELMMELE